MNTQASPSPQFYLTAPAACPYLPGDLERKVFTHLVGPRAAEMNDLLTQGGFRRSQNIAYRPACEACRACVSVRILAHEFEPARSMKRVSAANSDVVSTMGPAQPSTEQFSLFRRYLDHRHQRGGMSDMSALDYAIMVEDTHVNTRLIEYRRRMMSDGLSMVYSFFDPALEKQSLGTHMILDHISRTRSLGLPHVYLGYWVKGSSKMGYKTRFQPQEHLTPRGWELYEASAEA
jgi:arginine-tRNA-protein transferase